MMKMVETGTPIDALNGGVRFKSVNLLYGPTACGKTSLMIKMAQNLSKKGWKIIYIDTEGALYGDEFEGKILYADTLREQGDAVRKAAKIASVYTEPFLIIVDTLTGHFHRQVQGVPSQFRATKAGDLTGPLVSQIAVLKRVVRRGGIAFVTAHLRSKVSEAFRQHELRKVAELVKSGKYMPTREIYARLFERDIEWLGGHGLGMHTQFHFRIWIDRDGSRILQIEKWPLVSNWCVRYVKRGDEFVVLGERFEMDQELRARLMQAEVEALMARAVEGVEETSKIAEEEGIEVEEAKPKRGKAETGGVELPQPEPVDKLIEKFKKGSGK